jgi:hypothetical protein
MVAAVFFRCFNAYFLKLKTNKAKQKDKKEKATKSVRQKGYSPEKDIPMIYLLNVLMKIQRQQSALPIQSRLKKLV